MRTLLIAFLTTSFFSLAHATDSKNQPCKEVKAACEAAGYVKGGHKDKKGLRIDCLRKLMKGESVEGVSVASDKIAACKEKKEKHKNK
jgi:hypothetical protein